MSLLPLRTLFFEDLSVGMTEFVIFAGKRKSTHLACKILNSDLNFAPTFRSVERTRQHKAAIRCFPCASQNR